MSNINTLAFLNWSSAGGSLQKTIKTLSLGTSTTETAFSLNTNPINSTFGGGPAVIAIPQADLSPSGRFVVRASGYVSTGGADTLTLKLYRGTSATLGSDTAVFAPTGVGSLNGLYSWLFETQLCYQFAATTAQIIGSGTQVINATLATAAATTAQTGILVTDNLSFVLSAKFTTGQTGNLVVMSQFSIDAI